MCACLLHVPSWGPGPQPRKKSPGLGIKSATLWFAGWRSIPEQHHAGIKWFLMILLCSKINTTTVRLFSNTNNLFLTLYNSNVQCVFWERYITLFAFVFMQNILLMSLEL